MASPLLLVVLVVLLVVLVFSVDVTAVCVGSAVVLVVPPLVLVGLTAGF